MASSPSVLESRSRAGLTGRPAPGRLPRRLNRDTRTAAGFLSFNLTGFTGFTLIPLALAIYVSFFNWPLQGGRTRVGGLHNYGNVLSSFGFWRIGLNVLYFVGAYVPLNLIVSLTLAALLGPRVRAVKGKAFLRIVFFLPVVTPLVASSLLWALIYNQNGIFNTGLGWFGLGPVPCLSCSHWLTPALLIMSLWLVFGCSMILFLGGIANNPDTM